MNTSVMRRGLVAAGAIIVLGVAGLVAADVTLRHGVEARWAVLADTGEAPEAGRSARPNPANQAGWVDVTQTLEHRPDFPNRHRPLSRIAQSMDFETLGVPPSLFRFRAELNGRLQLERGGELRAEVAAGGTVVVEVDGEQLDADAVLEPGSYEVHATWVADLQRDPALRWTLDGAPIPATVWSPPPSTSNPLRWFVWIAGLLAILLFAGAAAWAGRGDRTTARGRWALVGFAGVLLLGLTFRLTGYAVMPDMLENDDYLFATWNGWSLLEDGTSRGWSLWHYRYGNRVEHESVPYFREDGRSWNVVSPYFEHPPGMHLLVGAVAHLAGAEHFTHARLVHTRLVPIALAGVTLLLMFLIGRRLDPNPATALLGCALWATIPFIAIQTRAIKEEALLTPMALFGFWAYLRWRDDRRARWIVAAGFTLGLCSFVKVPGIIFLPPLILLLLAEGEHRAALIAAGAGALGAAVLLLYALVVDWNLFWFATAHQASGRPTHWNIFPRFFSAGLINFNHIGHPQLIFLWIAYALGVMRLRAEETLAPLVPVLVVPPIVYLGAIAVSSGNWTFGWYVLPILPFLCLGAGRFLVDTWREPEALRGLLVVGLLVMYGMNFLHDPEWLKDPKSWAPMRALTTVFFSLSFLPFLLSYLARDGRFERIRGVARGMLGVLLVLHVAASAFFVAHYDTIYETHRNFDRDEYFDR